MISLNEIVETLRPFCDAATELETSPSADTCRVKITRFGEERTYLINLRTERIDLRGNKPQQFASLNSLLASDQFADLRYMADTQRRMLQRQMSSLPFMQPELNVGGASDGLDQLRRKLNAPPSERLEVILLDGPAGVGKTYLIERLSWEHAESYAKGGVRQPPVLHVTSRGRRLSNLRDALAATLNILHAKFHFNEVPVLVRRGMLLLAVDGFDELVDADGYKDAWYALKSFLSDIGVGGCCILAGRDTFFDQQGFRDRLQQEQGRLELTLAHLAAVRPENAKQWLIEQGWPESEARSSFADAVLDPGSYTLRPFFLSELAPLKQWSALDGRSPREFLISKFLDREAALVSRMVQVETVAARKALGQLFQEVALDMMDREADTVDLEYIKLLCQLVFEGVLSSEDIRLLQHKIGSTGLLESDAIPNHCRFPHSELQNHFLAHALLSSDSKDPVRRILRRAIFGADFLQVFLEVCEELPTNIVNSRMRIVKNLLDHEMEMDRMPQNGGALLVVAASAGFLSSQPTIANVNPTEVIFESTSAPMTLRDVSIGQLQARSADLRQIAFEKCQVTVLVADNLTQFGTTIPSVTAIHIVDIHDTTTLRAPPDVQRWLEDHSSRTASTTGEFDAGLPLVKFFDRVCRRALHQVFLREDADDIGGKLLADASWPEVERILVHEQRLERLTRPMHGPASDLIRIVNPKALLHPPPNDASSQRTRAAVIARARELS